MSSLWDQKKRSNGPNDNKKKLNKNQDKHVPYM